MLLSSLSSSSSSSNTEMKMMKCGGSHFCKHEMCDERVGGEGTSHNTENPNKRLRSINASVIYCRFWSAIRSTRLFLLVWNRLGQLVYILVIKMVTCVVLWGNVLGVFLLLSPHPFILLLPRHQTQGTPRLGKLS